MKRTTWPARTPVRQIASDTKRPLGASPSAREIMGHPDTKDRLPATEHPKLLFVDDEENIRTTLSMMLEANGFAVTSAATVADALRLIANEQFEVLIADLNVGSPG